MKRALTYSLSCVCALVLLMGCARDGAQMREQLSALEQRNRSDEPMVNDSLAEALADYFDRHGSANERMRAKYILGRTYYCLGELPRALETYMEAADCADTTAADCDFAKLSRIHAQSAVIFNQQVQPRSQLRELRLAEHYAWKGLDTLQAIECYAQQADAYSFLMNSDSAILIKENASILYKNVGHQDWAAMTLGTVIRSLIKRGEIEKAKFCCLNYETCSGLFDDNGNIEKGREIYYSIKGDYYLATHHLDSAEYMFRKELRDGKDLNNQIAGCRGLQKIYEQKKNSDSIAKYATLSYELNDSAYSLAEMQNIQKMQASYNYNHQKQLAEERNRDVRNAYFIIGIIVLIIFFVALISWLWFQHHQMEDKLKESQYQQTQNLFEQAQSDLMELREKNAFASDLIIDKSKEIESLKIQIAEYQRKQSVRDYVNVEDFLFTSPIIKDLTDLLECNPVQTATQGQLRELRKMINELIPDFYEKVNLRQPLRSVEYDVCLLIRCHFRPSAISKLLGRDDAYISNLRKGILFKVYGIVGSPGELDKRIMRIQ